MKQRVAAEHREHTVNRLIHRFFWRGLLRSKLHLGFTVVPHVVAFFIWNILVPLQIALGLEAIVTSHFDKVGERVLLIGLLTIVYIIVFSVANNSFNRVGVKGGKYIQEEVFSNYLSKDYSFYTNQFIGSLGAQAARVIDGFHSYTRIMLYDTIKVLVIIGAGIVVIATRSLLVAGLTLICMVFVLSFTIITSRWRSRHRRRVSQVNSHLAALEGDALGHGTTVKTFTAEQYELKQLSSALGPWQQIQLRAWQTKIPTNAVSSVLNALTVGITLLATAALYRNSAITIATVALVQLYVIKLIGATDDIADIIKLYEETMGGVYQSIQTMLIPSTISDQPTPRHLQKAHSHTINLNNVSFRYPEANKNSLAIKNFSLIIEQGQRIGLVGYSGSGKTTLTKLLLRFMDVTSGSIALDDIDIRELAQKDLRLRLAYVPQEPLLFHRSVAENIAYGRPGADQKDVERVARMAYVDEFALDLPNGYDTIVGERGVKLSGGQRQRVAIARALLKDAPILVLDEATSALDSRSEGFIQEALWQLMKNRTAVVVAHRLSTIQRLDKIVVMDGGQLVDSGSHTELLKKPESIYAQLWQHQSGGYIQADTISN